MWSALPRAADEVWNQPGTATDPLPASGAVPDNVEAADQVGGKRWPLPPTRRAPHRFADIVCETERLARPLETAVLPRARAARTQGGRPKAEVASPLRHHSGRQIGAQFGCLREKTGPSDTSSRASSRSCSQRASGPASSKSNPSDSSFRQCSGTGGTELYQRLVRMASS